MRLRTLKLIQFRNSPAGLDGPYAQFNGIFGPNGRGKTNFLEAIYYLTHLKSWRVSQPADLIAWGQSEASLLATFETDGREHTLNIHFFPKRREVMLDTKPLRSWESYRAALVAILFSPEDAYLWREGPDRRRAALDQMLFHRDHTYAGIVSRYLKSLKQKNALLKTDIFDPVALATWNDQLVMYGSEIIARRAQCLSEIMPHLQTYYTRIATGSQARTTVGGVRRFLATETKAETPLSTAEAESRFRQLLDERRELERLQKTSLVGPHRDDWWLLLDGHPVSITASQGEHRSLIVALKLAELNMLKTHLGEAPIFLVDDLTSELDANRRRFLIETLIETGCQIFLTSTDKAPFEENMPSASRIFEL